jgi:hypothetical protein
MSVLFVWVCASGAKKKDGQTVLLRLPRFSSNLDFHTCE